MPPLIFLATAQGPLRFAFTDYFRQHGYEIQCATDLTGTKTALSECRCSVLLLDMPLENQGWQEQFNDIGDLHHLFPNVRIVALVTHSSPRFVRQARLNGVDLCLEKPQQLWELEQAVWALLSGATTNSLAS